MEPCSVLRMTHTFWHTRSDTLWFVNPSSPCWIPTLLLNAGCVLAHHFSNVVSSALTRAIRFSRWREVTAWNPGLPPLPLRSPAYGIYVCVCVYVSFARGLFPSSTPTFLSEECRPTLCHLRVYKRTLFQFCHDFWRIRMNFNVSNPASSLRQASSGKYVCARVFIFLGFYLWIFLSGMLEEVGTLIWLTSLTDNDMKLFISLEYNIEKRAL